jgi:hypothetical protein
MAVTVRIGDAPEMRIVAGDAERSLVHGEFPENDRAARAQVAHDVGIRRGDTIGSAAKAIPRGHPGDVDVVLSRDWDAVERPESPLRRCPCGGGIRLRERSLLQEADIAVDPPPHALGAREKSTRQILRVGFSRVDQLAKPIDGLERQFGHARNMSVDAILPI